MASSDMTATLRNEERLRTEMAHARDELADSIAAIQERLLEATDWRAVVRRRPLTVLLCAGAVGFLIARLEIPRRKDER